jgi:hypothetical protein
VRKCSKRPFTAFVYNVALDLGLEEFVNKLLAITAIALSATVIGAAGSNSDGGYRNRSNLYLS